MRIATARINYLARSTQVVLNTTVKSGCERGKLFAPTWELVMNSKRGVISWEEYTQQYYALMRSRYAQNKAGFVNVLQHNKLVVTCYCADTSTTTQHCHRYLLVDILKKVGEAHGIAVEYVGEVK